MKHFIRALSGLLIFWLLFFTVERTIFLLWYTKTILRESIPFTELLNVYWYAFKLDLSTAAYILIVPVLLLSVQQFYRKKWISRVHTLYTAVVIILYSFIAVGEIGLFKEWNTKLSFKALLYLQRPDEVMNSVQTSDFIMLFSLVVLLSVCFIYLYIQFFHIEINNSKPKSHLSLRIVFITIAWMLLFVSIRGGLGEIPITASNSYFSKHHILNIAAVNPGYNIVFSILNHTNLSELEPFFKWPEEEALKMVKEMHEVPKDTTVRISWVERPNIVFILLESWPGDVIESLGGEPGITPQFKKLESEGLLFTNFFASGNRSQQGNASIFAGLPALPMTTLSDHPEKYAAVPSLVKALNSEGYYTSFYFGGQLIYGNLKSFLVSNEFDLIVEEDDFDVEMTRGKLGVHDEFVFERYAHDMQQMQQPFFSTVFTLSSHSPYDYPGERPIDWIKVEQKFVNSVHYTDRCLGNFFNEISESEIWENTLFLIMSDHSHLSYRSYPLVSFEYHRIPLLITGGALKDEFKGEKLEGIYSNHDIPATILKQLDLPANDYHWSRNMFNPYSPQFAFFELTDGFGWKRPYGELVKSVANNWYYKKNAPKDHLPLLEKEGQVYTQQLIREFLSY
ncbi:MAG: sulfatase-like hydrolase/transferase [Bacteroidetes bacterium]|nr:sulfatase-like hydrolase/transferase [Bacteroidota bacterium]